MENGESGDGVLRVLCASAFQNNARMGFKSKGGSPGPPSTLTNQRMLDANQRALISHRLATRGYLTLCVSVPLCFPRPRKVAPSPGVLP